MSKKFYIFPLSDLHLGSKQCDIHFFNKWRREFENTSDNKCIYLLGDLLEFPTTRIDSYSVNMSTHDALERLVNFLEPYKEYIRYVCTGNHEARSLKDFNYDITKTIASRLDSSYTRSDFFDKLHLEGGDLVVYGKHGTKISKNPLLAMNNFVNDMNHIDADLYIHGHNHYTSYYSQFQRSADNGKRRFYLFSGHFLKYDGYARNKGLLFSPPSFTRLTVDKHMNVSAKSYYNDGVEL